MTRQLTGLEIAHLGLFGCALFGFSLVSTVPAILDMPSGPFSIGYRAAILGASMLYIAARALSSRQSSNLRQTSVLIAGIWTLLTVRLAWDSGVTELPLDLPWGEYWLLFIGVTVIPATAFFWTISDAAIIRMRTVCEILGIIAVLSLLILGALFVLNSDGAIRLATEVLNPISIGHVGVSAAIVLGASITASNNGVPRHWLARVLRILAAGLSVALVLASASKGPIAALAIVLVVSSLVRPTDSGDRIFLRAAQFVTVVVVGVAIAVTLERLTSIAVISRFTNALQDYSTLTRVEMQLRALSQFEESPLLGSSFVEFSTRFYPHNIIVESLMATGFVGAFLLTALLLVSCIACLLILVRLHEARWLGLLYVQYFVDAMLSGSLYFSSQFWIVTIVILAASQRAFSDLTRSISKRANPSGNQRELTT